MNNRTRKLIASLGVLILCAMAIAAHAFAEAKSDEKDKPGFYFDSKSGPEICPKCNVKTKTVPIVYGRPALGVFDRVERGEAVLGGCIVSSGHPTMATICPKCKKVFGRY